MIVIRKITHQFHRQPHLRTLKCLTRGVYKYCSRGQKCDIQ